MVILQWGCVIVGDGQRVAGLDEEVVVDTAMLVVMHQRRPVGGHLLQPAHSFVLQHTPMADQHVTHLQH